MLHWFSCANCTSSQRSNNRCSYLSFRYSDCSYSNWQSKKMANVESIPEGFKVGLNQSMIRLKWLLETIYLWVFLWHGVLEYANCNSAQGVRFPVAINEHRGYNTKLDRMLRLEYWIFGDGEVPFHKHDSQFWLVVHVRGWFMKKIKVFSHFLSIITSDFK